MENSYDSKMESKGYLPFKMGNLNDWMVKKAKEELNETAESRDLALEKLRRLIAKEKNLDIWTDDQYLLQFLRAGKSNPERAMGLIRNLYGILKDNPDIYPKQLDTDEIFRIIEANAGGVFPYRHKDGGIIAFINIAKWDPDRISIERCVSAMTFLILSVIEDPATQVCGVHLVYDARYTMRQARLSSPRYIKLCSKLVRFHFHGSDMKQLHKYIPKDILPPEYGGDIINYSASEFSKKELSPFLKKYSEILKKGYF